MANAAAAAAAEAQLLIPKLGVNFLYSIGPRSETL